MPLRTLTGALALASLLCCALAAAEGPDFWRRQLDPDGLAWEQALSRGRDALQARDPDRLDAAAQEAALLKPDAFETKWLQAALLQARGEHERALALLEALGQQETPDHLPRGAVAEARAASLARLGRWDEAAAALREALAVDPHDQAAQLGIALCLEGQGDHASARQYLLSLLTRDPSLAILNEEPAWRPQERALARALLLEELGRSEEALAALTELEQLPANTLARLRGARAPVVGQGPLPLLPSAAVADPRGRFIALGDRQGRIWMARLRDQAILWAPSLSGPAVVDLAIDPARGELVVAHDDSFLGRLELERGGRLLGSLGPLALANGTTPRALTGDGAAVVATSGRAYVWTLARLDDLGQERGQLQMTAQPLAHAAGRWDAAAQSAPLALLLPGGQLQVLSIPAQGEPVEVTPPRLTGPKGPARASALRYSPDGRFLFVASARALVTLRASDLRVLRILELAPEEGALDVVGVVVDPAGGAGHGPAVLTLHPGRYRAIALEAALPDETLTTP